MVMQYTSLKVVLRRETMECHLGYRSYYNSLIIIVRHCEKGQKKEGPSDV
jgi:hypothetical protein